MNQTNLSQQRDLLIWNMVNHCRDNTNIPSPGTDGVNIIDTSYITDVCNDTALDTISYLDTLRTRYPRNIFMAHLNVNSIRYNFFEIHDILSGNRIDIFGLAETKVDASFTSAQFSINGFKLYRQDRDS